MNSTNKFILQLQRALKAIPIQEIPHGKTSPEKTPTRIEIIEIEDDKSHGDSNNNDSNKKIQEDTISLNGDEKPSAESEKLQCENVTEKVSVKNMVPPVNSVQFMSQWKYMKGRVAARSDYLSVSTFYF